ncbi:Fe-S cluster assembly protein SufD [Rhodococcus fascians]|nr:FeS assembly protein [Rhodococcus sp. PML026]MDP9636510.1 Fe-S cluster assembly protein SufD [Rhodococcus cercidiphylli]MDQ0283190.1 Fe-S cluster assembly protein SufD [Rhodococcus fascians]MDR6911069.1 Fe-S cluster assembly protein SufD [Rhodococcus sp. 3258]GHP15489.1 Fe-S cluster assembly protein SufD [Rhodococcus sp. NKCM2511]
MNNPLTGVMGAVASENPDSAKEDKSKLVANKGAQFTSYDVNAFEVPSGRDELWRFTPLRRLRGLHDGSAVADGTAQVTVGAADQVVVETVGRDDDRLGKAGVPADRIAAQAYSAFTEATIVSVPNEVEVAEPIEITIDGPGVDHVAYGHVQIRLGTFARATVVIDQRGSGTYAENVEFVLGDSSQLHVVLIQDWQSDAVHVAAHHALLGRDSVLRHYNVSLGGDLVRISPTVRYSAPGGDANMLGVYFADAGQHLEQRLLVDHSAPHCKSNVMYKGALQGETGPGTVDAHTVWIGDVLIRAEAEGTETYELNRNLVLTDGARADSVPNLEIETGEIVGAGHASATGRFDDEQLFYLRARGISEEVARRLVVRGFFHEIIDKIPVPAVRERLDAAIETELAVVGA